jgi:hypothetical protein
LGFPTGWSFTTQQATPYIITEVIPGGAYRLQDKKTGKDESNQWNAEQLRRFYA